MSKFKAKKKSFFRSGLALVGEKKVFNVNEYDKTITKSSKPGEEFKWTLPELVYDDIDSII